MLSNARVADASVLARQQHGRRDHGHPWATAQSRVTLSPRRKEKGEVAREVNDDVLVAHLAHLHPVVLDGAARLPAELARDALNWARKFFVRAPRCARCDAEVSRSNSQH